MNGTNDGSGHEAQQQQEEGEVDAPTSPSLTHSIMESVQSAREQIKGALQQRDSEYELFTQKLRDAEKMINDRLQLYESKVNSIDTTYGNDYASEDDVIEINAGGRIIAANRGTLCQIKNTRLHALFNGRWDGKLQRDNDGRIFLDVNPKAFLAIVDYLTDMKLSPVDTHPDPPSVSGEYSHILFQLVNLFGIADELSMGGIPESSIIQNKTYSNILHNWLKEDGSDGKFELLYKASRDDGLQLKPKTFHSKCDRKGSTITIIETHDYHIVGGYSNSSWSSPVDPPSASASATLSFGAQSVVAQGAAREVNPFTERAARRRGLFDRDEDSTSSEQLNQWSAANKAFLFAIGSACHLPATKMKLKNAFDQKAVLSNRGKGPSFGSRGQGCDFTVRGDIVQINAGGSYEAGPMMLTINAVHKIREMEVYRVIQQTTKQSVLPTQINSNETKTMKETSSFAKCVNDALNSKLKALQNAEEGITLLESRLEDEIHFINTFSSGDAKDVVTLNISGTSMATKRSTLRVFEESALARQFDDSTWQERSDDTDWVNWTPDMVHVWVKNVDGIPNEVADKFKENEITGRELLTLGIEGLKMLGIERTGTICLLLAEINKLEKANQITAPFFEHSPYCFGKILDYLRLKRLHTTEFVDAPVIPTVRGAEKTRFERVVQYFFPGDSSKLILGYELHSTH